MATYRPITQEFVRSHARILDWTGWGNHQIFPESNPALPEVDRPDLHVHVLHMVLPERQLIPCAPGCADRYKAQAQAFRAIGLY